MLELLFLLLPVAAAYGWYMGRRSAQQDKQDEANRLSRDYVTGVNFLLSNQQDKAVELFLDMLKDDTNTFEAHLTLGNLFRSRGEVDRAIRIHQALTESTALTFEQRLLAVQQLGRDYMTAGLYDRAEKIFKQLVDEEDFRLSALQQLLQIYQATSDWQTAIDTAEKLVKLGTDRLRVEIAHFYCELALQFMGNDDLNKAMALLKKAIASDNQCARASIMIGRIYMAQQQFSPAIAALQQVLEQDRDFVSETLPMLEECYQHLHQPQDWSAFLKRCVEENTGATAELMLADIIEREDGTEVAQIYINRQIQRHPTMRGFHRLMDFHLREAEDGRAKESLVVLRKMVGEQVQTKPRYSCNKCGFTSQSLYWHCPSCRTWASIKPIRGLDGE
ncbi:lipopolysaccharide assembly protein LapB [Pectobacteriaceae bacterium CE70]|uniref:Lipopolysaccharide assembly protein B n=1 Tax=Serratia sp. (strain ATCC 39006) TaxID=104623 RepID=A0A2I5TJV8_SERS3|nr:MULTISPECIES: lipopolysaccharide assembly protein LapB [Enterobacterales]WJV56380.1 lipopolysaccharide assembly protein LapB [Pectobacteriaceae bacterium C111]WJV68764.1 lipopolysaccharide assembly protein LapB [Pectobacteriaceae bacterium CE70]WJY12689.1 lipopolysaccharide assembly protein LapB [Pectobacteriaceae bacterium C80]AUH00527.1 lipopolysaccharide assembly protein LapB [Serratia sp. ATCC 39006]AUH04847.1 lipopolysaccharide assembly protein LapB [Serratia sp. ATCC 39006]